MNVPWDEDIDRPQTGETPGALLFPMTPDGVAGESPVRPGPTLARRRMMWVLATWLSAGTLAGAFVAFLWWMSVVPLRGAAPPQQLTIPNGTNAAIERGAEPPGLPRRIELLNGQRLYVVNLDSAEHLIAGTLIRPGTSTVIEPAVLSADEVSCTVHPSGAIAVALRGKPRALDSTLRGSLFGAPLGLFVGFIAMLGQAVRPRWAGDKSGKAPGIAAAGGPTGSQIRRNTWLVARGGIGLLGVSLVVLGTLVARSPANPVGSTARAAASGEADLAILPPVTESADALFFVDNDEWAPLPNGDSITVGDLVVTVTISPYPPGRQANLDLGIMQAGVPVSGANVTLEYDMRVMEHGALRLLALPGGAGHYLMPLDFIMAGEFQLKVVVDTADAKETMTLGVRATR